MTGPYDHKVIDFARQSHARLLRRVDSVEEGTWVATSSQNKHYLSRFKEASLRTVVDDLEFKNPMSYECAFNTWTIHNPTPYKFCAALVFDVDVQFEFSGDQIFFQSEWTTRWPAFNLAYRFADKPPVREVPDRAMYLQQDAALEYLIRHTEAFDSTNASKTLRETIIPAIHSKNRDIKSFTRSNARKEPSLLGKLIGLWEV